MTENNPAVVVVVWGELDCRPLSSTVDFIHDIPALTPRSE